MAPRWLTARNLLLAAALAVYVAFVAWYYSPYAGGSDSSGYLNSAKQLLAGELTLTSRVPTGFQPGELRPELLAPLGYNVTPASQVFTPSYPVGLPLHLAAVGWLCGIENATRLVGLGSALAFLALLYLTAREFGVNSAWRIGLVVLAALSPLCLLYALQPMSDLLAACWALALIFCALRAGRHPGWAAAAGAALAIAVLVRPTNVLLVLPALAALPRRFASWLAFGLGGLPGAIFLGFYNQTLYGQALASGYGDVSALFSWANMPGTLWHYAVWLPVVATPLVFLAAGLPWLNLPSRPKWVLGAWAGAVFLFYSSYECTHETWWYLRFVLPGLPALGLAAALVGQRLSQPSWLVTICRSDSPANSSATPAAHSLRLSLAGVLFTLAAIWSAWWSFSRLHVHYNERSERAYALAGRWVATQMPADALLAGFQVSGAIAFYSDRTIINYREFVPGEFARFDQLLRKHHLTLYALLFDFEEADALRRMPGRWEKTGTFRQVGLWRRLPEADAEASGALHALPPVAPHAH